MVLNVRPSPAMRVRVDVVNPLSEHLPDACPEATPGTRFEMGGATFQTFFLENVKLCTFTTRRD